ncbi:MAG: hypothetical protein ABIP53_00055 [Candidatus Limnocylindrales bacterium]
MASNLAAVGLAVESEGDLNRMIQSMSHDFKLLGRAAGIDIWRWQDPSGARLIVSTQEDAIRAFTPSFAGTPGARLAAVEAVNDDVSRADVIDDTDHQPTALTLELEQRDLVRGARVKGEAALVALASEITIHSDAEAFAASSASLLDAEGATSQPPAHFVEKGWAWPPRMGPESFISYGVFEQPDVATAFARLHGTVVTADLRTNSLTGQRFIAARVRSSGFEADLCMSAREHAIVPGPGAVVGGTVFMVGSIDAWTVHSIVILGATSHTH